MEDQAEAVARIICRDAEREARIDAEARAIVHALIQGGPWATSYSALVQALKAAREQGQVGTSVR